MTVPKSSSYPALVLGARPLPPSELKRLRWVAALLVQVSQQIAIAEDQLRFEQRFFKKIVAACSSAIESDITIGAVSTQAAKSTAVGELLIIAEHLRIDTRRRSMTGDENDDR